MLRLRLTGFDDIQLGLPPAPSASWLRVPRQIKPAPLIGIEHNREVQRYPKNPPVSPILPLLVWYDLGIAPS